MRLSFSSPVNRGTELKAYKIPAAHKPKSLFTGIKKHILSPKYHKLRRKIMSYLECIPYVKTFRKRKYYRKIFKTEWALIKGVHTNRSRHPSIIHFSMNKAATQYVKSILVRCAEENGLVPVHISGYAFNTNFPLLHNLPAKKMKKYRHIFKRRGYLYSVIAGMIEGIPDLEEYKIVLHIGDPRDVLVSHYYSTAYSHRPPDRSGNKYRKFMSRRKEAGGSTIDDFVRSQSLQVYDTFRRYQNLLLDKYQNTHLTTYERMVRQFDDWLSELVGCTELDVSEELLQSLVEEHEKIRPKGENIHRHLRRGIPGDYKEKLQLETIEYLNEKFMPILKRFHYDH